MPRVAIPCAVLALAACQSDAQLAALRPDPEAPPDVATGTLSVAPEPADADPPGDSGLRDSGLRDSGLRDSGLRDSGAPDGDPPDPAERCLTWESATLFDAGYTGDFVELWDGAMVLVAREGVTAYSALEGEEALDYRDDHALVLRSSHDGDTGSTAIATTPLWDIPEDGSPQLWWWQLSEVDGDGIELYADLIDAAGTIVASLDVPVETGGYLPGLLPSHAPIDGFDEIVEGPGQVGELVLQSTDLTPFAGQRLRLRLYQHTRVENNGFFTVFDDLCLGAGEAPALLSWGPPDPTH